MKERYYDFTEATESVQPFVGGGIGVLAGKMEGSGYSVSSNTFGYQLIAGLGFKVGEKTMLDVSYHLLGAASDFEKDGDKLSYISSNILLGIRQSF